MNYNLIAQKSNLKPRPVPNLKDSAKSYVNFIKPYNHDCKNEVENSERKLEELIKSTGAVLQKRVADKFKSSPGWLYNFLLDNKILTKRDPIPISNYYLLFDFHFKDQIEAVAKIILCSILLKKLLKDNKISQITSKDFYQYYLLFHSYRLPLLNRDKLLLNDIVDNRYVILIYRNVFWMLETTLDYDKICDQISYITSLDLSEKSENYIGILTSTERNKWCLTKEKFTDISDNNKEFLYSLERSMIIFSLDDKSSTDLILKEINDLCLFGDKNKLFDKLIQFIVLKDGFVAMNVQRDLIDQSVCIEFAKLILQWTSNSDLSYIDRKKDVDNKTNYFENFSFKPIKLNYVLNKEIKSRIKNAYEDFNIIQSEFKTEFLFFNEYGRELLDRRGLVGVSYIQLGILASYYRTFNKVVPSRQLVWGRNFAWGIPEWIRTTTKESSNFSVAINEMKVPRDLKIKLGQDAFKQYKNISLDVNNGKSIDTHFIALQAVLEADEPIPSFFEDEIYLKSMQFVIDTYPILSDFVKLAANAPPCQDGVSITYILRKDHIQFIGTAYYDLKKYFQNLIEVLKEMKDLFIEKERDFYLRSKF